MSTYLELCQSLRQECYTSYSNQPTTVAGQTGAMANVVTWISKSYKDIQLRYDNWRWMRSNFTVNTVASTDSYDYTDCTDTKTGSAISRFSHWWANDPADGFRSYLTSGGVSGQQWLRYLEYEKFRSFYKFGAQQSQTGQPFVVSVDDDEKIVLGPNPDAIYTISGSYQRGPQILTLDADEPDMPERFHDLIVYWAMQRYAIKAVAPEVLARANLEGGRLMRALEQSQLPKIRLGGPLA